MQYAETILASERRSNGGVVNQKEDVRSECSDMSSLGQSADHLDRQPFAPKSDVTPPLRMLQKATSFLPPSKPNSQ
jgi:hypothetical protein